MKRIAFALLVLAACDGDSPTSPDGPVPFTQVYASQYSGLRAPRTELIVSPARWAVVWGEITSQGSPQPPAPAIDFDRNYVVLAALGEQGDACKRVAIEGVELRGDLLQVSVKEARPPASCVCPPVTVQPVHAVAVPRLTTRASFSQRSVTEGNPCN